MFAIGMQRRRRFAVATLFCSIVLFCFGPLASIWAQGRTDVDENQPTLYFFTNDGCAPCLQVAPTIEALGRMGYPVKTVKVDQHPKFAESLGVRVTPTVALVANNRLVGRHAGMIDGIELKKWFASVGMTRPPATKPQLSSRQRPAGSGFVEADGVPAGAKVRQGPVGTKVVIDRQVQNLDYSVRGIETDYSSPTMIRGTNRPASRAEQTALQATVRLKVEDDEGISFATGTVVHTHGTESLVMTCGHVFRDSQGHGRITADYGFYDSPNTATGRLIDYDSDARDVALVVIQTNRPLPAVPLASRGESVRSGRDIFSIGCDHGEDPTIRRSRIKNRAAYDGSLKYDIFGRPVDGRSGGGLFTESGELIGVCNAAAVEVDEGIYSALETLHWQVAAVKLDHLFNGRSNKQQLAAGNRLAQSERGKSARFAEASAGQDRFATQLNDSRMGRIQSPKVHSQEDLQRRQPVTYSRSLENRIDRAMDKEVVITVRSKANPSRSEEIVIDDPTPELLNYLGGMQ